MKRILVLITVILLTGSCDDGFLDHQPDFYSEENVFSNVGRAEGVINSMLATRRFDRNMSKPLMIQLGGDDVTTKRTGLFNQYANGNIGPANPELTTMWKSTYQTIRTINEFLSNVQPKVEWGKDRERLLGEAYFMRAYFYLELLHFFGGNGLGVPIILEAQSIEANVFVDRSTYHETIKAIYADLDQAIALLPAPAESKFGRPNRGIALGYKSRTSLLAASKANNLTNDLQLWQFAAKCARDLIDTKYYALHPNYEEVFRKNNPELIFAYELNALANSMEINVQSPANGGQAVIIPTQNLVDSYEALKGNESVPFDWSDPAHAQQPYAHRAPRLVASILYHGASWTDRNAAPRPIDVSPKGIDMTASIPNATSTGYYVRKLADPNHFYRSNGGVVGNSLTNIIEMRYAEILLNYAEALLQLGETEEAIIYINQIRKRAKMPAISATQLTWERYENERRVELAFEGHRFFDVRRWARTATTFNTSYYGVNVKIDPVDQHVVYTRKLVNQRIYPPKMDILPIPQSEVDIIRSAIPTFQQNPGW